LRRVRRLVAPVDTGSPQGSSLAPQCRTPSTARIPSRGPFDKQPRLLRILAPLPQGYHRPSGTSKVSVLAGFTSISSSFPKPYP
jgi:hypothetical protein